MQMTPESISESIENLRAAAARKREREQARKAEAWDKVKTDYPDIADFITSMTATFGKPKRVVVRNTETNEVVLDSRKL